MGESASAGRRRQTGPERREGANYPRPAEAAAQLDAVHKLTVEATVTFTATGGTATAKAIVVHLVKATPVTPPAKITPSLSRLGVVPSKFSLARRKVKRRCVAPTKKNQANLRCRRRIKLRVTYALNVPTTVTFTVKLKAPGRRVNGRCVNPSRTLSVEGSLDPPHPATVSVVSAHR
jgi:hypothetical protein